MLSMLDIIDKYIKDNNIPFESISINRNYFPWFINMAILREIRKSSGIHYLKLNSEYELRYDKNNNLYLLVSNDRNRENFVIGNDRIKEDFKISGKSEKHIIKMGCLFKILSNDIKEVTKVMNEKYIDLDNIKKINIRYKIIDEMLEDKYKEFITNNKIIEDEVNYEDEIIKSTYRIMDYIRYLFELYNDYSSLNLRNR